jgi:plasmid stabilization system protein ParE
MPIPVDFTEKAMSDLDGIFQRLKVFVGARAAKGIVKKLMASGKALGRTSPLKSYRKGVRQTQFNPLEIRDLLVLSAKYQMRYQLDPVSPSVPKMIIILRYFEN